MDEENNQEVKYNLPNEEEQKKKNRRITGIFILLTTIVLDACSLFAYFATLKEKEKNETYLVPEESKSIYNNLLAFLKNICEADSHPVPNEIVAVNYQDDKLVVASKNDINEIYVSYDCGENITSFLDIFQKGIPSLEGYSIESSYVLTNEKEINIDQSILDNQYKSIISKSITNDYYISFTGFCSCGSMISMVHQQYDEAGNYTNKLKVGKDNKTLFGLLYFFSVWQELII